MAKAPEGGLRLQLLENELPGAQRLAVEQKLVEPILVDGDCKTKLDGCSVTGVVATAGRLCTVAVEARAEAGRRACIQLVAASAMATAWHEP